MKARSRFNAFVFTCTSVVTFGVTFGASAQALACLSIDAVVASVASPAEGGFGLPNRFVRRPHACFAPDEVVVDLGLTSQEKPARRDLSLFFNSEEHVQGELALACPKVTGQLNDLDFDLSKATRVNRNSDDGFADFEYSFRNGHILTQAQEKEVARRGLDFCRVEFSLPAREARRNLVWRYRHSPKAELSDSYSNGRALFSDYDPVTGDARGLGLKQYSLTNYYDHDLDQEGMRRLSVGCARPQASAGDASVRDFERHLKLNGRPIFKKVLTNRPDWQLGGRAVAKKILSERPESFVNSPVCRPTNSSSSSDSAAAGSSAQ